MIHRAWSVLVAALVLISASTAGLAVTATITVNPRVFGPEVSPTLYGIFLEEVNHAVDGGLYAELVRNRGFEAVKPPEGYHQADGKWLNPSGWDGGFPPGDDPLPYWTLETSEGARATATVSTEQPLSAAQSYHCRLQVSEPGQRCALVNDGYWGMGIRDGERYNLSLFARTEGFAGPLRAWLEADGKPLCDPVEVRLPRGDGWGQAKAELRAKATSGQAKLVLDARSPGLLCLDLVSLFPRQTYKNRANGLRPDLAALLAGLRPAFMRFPGGCILEGATLESAYDWRQAIGPMQDRPEIWGVWQQRRTHGMGLKEYLDLAEDLGATPMYVAFAGQTCIYRGPQLTPLDQMPALAQSMVDVVDYITGPANSPLGKLRAADGRRTPYKLGWLEIGNENQGPDYEARYKVAYEALKAKHPELTTIADYHIPGQQVDMVDHHYYNSPSWFTQNYNLYDTYDRNDPPVYIGEYAVTQDCGLGNLKGALAEAVFALGFERNADVVKMASYAPLLGHVDGKNWNPILINFDSLRAYGTPSYYVQRMLAVNRPDQMVKAECVVEPDGETRTVTGAVGVGTWLTSAAYRNLKVEAGGQVLYQDDFANGAQGWQPQSGAWSTVGDEYRQTDLGEGKVSYTGDQRWHDYTLTVEAKKLGGAEGFLVAFGRRDGHVYWWNLGGWGNREHGVEMDRITVGQRQPGHIEEGRWYQIKIELAGDRIRCYLDGELIHDLEALAEGGVWANAGVRADGTIIVKVVNTTDTILDANLTLDGIDSVDLLAEAEVLTSGRITDENDLAKPDRVSTIYDDVALSGVQSALRFAPQSFTVLRIGTKPGTIRPGLPRGGSGLGGGSGRPPGAPPPS